jgi:tRNA nucleotidyltransferase domain 2 putative
MLRDALRWRAQGPPAPLLGGDELIDELGVAPGPKVGEVLARLAEAQYAGEVTNRVQALALARRELAAG